MVFIDTGAFLARYVARDQHHEKAKAYWRELGTLGASGFTSNLVLAEFFTLLARRTDYEFAARRARAVYASEHLTILRPAEEDEHQALSYFEKYADQEVSFTDCVSFALMRRRKIKRVFGFDAHFEHAGFRRFP
jgi:hypothetical protein